MGPRCEWCDELVRRQRIGDESAQWVHDATDNVYCATNVQGHTAKFATKS
jgi:hypothetical protein